MLVYFVEGNLVNCEVEIELIGDQVLERLLRVAVDGVLGAVLERLFGADSSQMLLAPNHQILPVVPRQPASEFPVRNCMESSHACSNVPSERHSPAEGLTRLGIIMEFVILL